MIGGSAIGRYGIGQLPEPLRQSLILQAVLGAYIVTGKAVAWMRVKFSAVGTYLFMGQNAGRGYGPFFARGTYLLTGFTVTWLRSQFSARGTFLFTGKNVHQATIRLSQVGTYLYTGFGIGFGVSLLAQVGTYVLTGFSTILARLTGVSYINSRLIQPALSRFRKTPPKLTLWGS